MKNPDQPILLPELCCLTIYGSDATDFLQSQLSIDVHKLLPGQSRLGAYCEPKGRVISTFILSLIDETFFMLIPTVLKETLLKTLLRYRFRAKVEFETSTKTRVHGYYPETADIDDDTAKQAVYFSHPLDKLRHFILQEPKETRNEADLSASRHWAQADITVGMVWLDQRTTVKHLPQSLGLVDNNAVDFDKGCYPGQEIIARLKYLGQSQYAIYQFSTEIDCGDFKSTNTIRNSAGKRQGQRLNSYCYKQHLKGLFVVRHTALKADENLFLTDSAGNSQGKAIQFRSIPVKT